MDHWVNCVQTNSVYFSEDKLDIQEQTRQISHPSGADPILQINIQSGLILYGSYTKQ